MFLFCILLISKVLCNDLGQPGSRRILANEERLVLRGPQVLSPKSLEINLCNVNHSEHGSWDLPLKFTRDPKS